MLNYLEGGMDKIVHSVCRFVFSRRPLLRLTSLSASLNALYLLDI